MKTVLCLTQTNLFWAQYYRKYLYIKELSQFNNYRREACPRNVGER